MKPHAFSWRFQTYARRKVVELSPNRWRIAEGGSSLVLEGCAVGTSLALVFAPTEVVWAYANENADQPFAHAAFVTPADARVITADFKIRWDDRPAAC